MPGMPACADKVSGSGCKRVGAEAQPTSVMATMAAATLRLKSGNNRILQHSDTQAIGKSSHGVRLCAGSVEPALCLPAGTKGDVGCAFADRTGTPRYADMLGAADTGARSRAQNGPI